MQLWTIPFNITRNVVNKLISIFCSLMVIYLADVVVIFRLFESFVLFLAYVERLYIGLSAYLIITYLALCLSFVLIIIQAKS